MKWYANGISAAILATTLGLGLVGCGTSATAATNASSRQDTQAIVAQTSQTSAESTTESTAEAGDTYTDRDLAQTADLSSATSIAVESGQDVSITKEGVYVLSGTATNATISVDVDSNAKVQLVLDNLTLENETKPAIYVLSADKVFVTTAQGSTNKLTTSETFAADGENNVDGVIFSKDDLVLNGQGTLAISSSDNGVVSKDDLKVTGGTYSMACNGDALQANEGVYVADGNLELVASSDGIQGDARVQIDGGTITISGAEGIESTYVQINQGKVSISASDDGINATQKSETSTDTPTIEIAGGEVAVEMGSGDTDALDANGNIVVSGGTINITAQSAFDYDGTAEFTGGTIYVNGEQVTTIENSMMGGGMGGRMGGEMPGGGMGGGMMGGPRQ